MTLSPVVGKVADPTLVSCSTWESGPCTSHGWPNRTDPIGGCGELTQEHEHGRPDCILPLPYGSGGGGEMPSPTASPHLWQVGDDPEVIRVVEVSLPLTSHSTRESGPYTSAGHHSRPGPKGVGMGELTLRS